MSAMNDVHAGLPVHAPEGPAFNGLRDTLLALCLTILAALALEAMHANGTLVGADAPVVQDWKGNSGGLPAAL